MFDLTYKIKIGKYLVKVVSIIVIKKSVEQLSDTAVITLPATLYNSPIVVEDKLLEGDVVQVWLGYDGALKLEFEGYLESITTDEGTLTLQCEDELYQYRKDVPNKELPNADVKKILEYVNQSIGGGLQLDCNYSFTYDKFTIYNATGFDVLKKIQDESKANIYLVGKTLHVHPQYTQLGDKVIYDFAKNVEKSDLKYRDAKRRKFIVEVEGKGVNGKVIKVSKGTPGGDKVSLKIDGVSNVKTLETMATNQLAVKSYTGYEGTLTSWLIPSCKPTDQAEIRDADFEFKKGTYYVKAVTTNYSESGGSRQIEIGKKL